MVRLGKILSGIYRKYVYNIKIEFERKRMEKIYGTNTIEIDISYRYFWWNMVSGSSIYTTK